MDVPNQISNDNEIQIFVINMDNNDDDNDNKDEKIDDLTAEETENFEMMIHHQSENLKSFDFQENSMNIESKDSINSMNDEITFAQNNKDDDNHNNNRNITTKQKEGTHLNKFYLNRGYRPKLKSKVNQISITTTLSPYPSAIRNNQTRKLLENRRMSLLNSPKIPINSSLRKLIANNKELKIKMNENESISQQSSSLPSDTSDEVEKKVEMIKMNTNRRNLTSTYRGNTSFRRRNSKVIKERN